MGHALQTLHDKIAKLERAISSKPKAVAATAFLLESSIGLYGAINGHTTSAIIGASGSLAVLMIPRQYKPLAAVRKEVLTLGYIGAGTVKFSAIGALAGVQVLFRTFATAITAGAGLGAALLSKELFSNAISSTDWKSAAAYVVGGAASLVVMCLAGKGAASLAVNGFPEDKPTNAPSDSTETIEPIKILSIRECFGAMGGMIKNAPKNVMAFRKRIDEANKRRNSPKPETLAA